jgi:hypothetical protein
MYLKEDAVSHIDYKYYFTDINADAFYLRSSACICGYYFLTFATG